MTVEQLIKELQSVSKYTQVVVRGNDHSYRRIHVVGTEKAEMREAINGRRHLSEYHDTPWVDGVEYLEVLVIE